MYELRCNSGISIMPLKYLIALSMDRIFLQCTRFLYCISTVSTHGRPQGMGGWGLQKVITPPWKIKNLLMRAFSPCEWSFFPHGGLDSM